MRRPHRAYIALLRAVNVGGSKPVAMAPLRGSVMRLGHQDVSSVGQSGNLVFHAPPRTTGALARQLAAQFSAELGLHTDVFVRTAAEWQALIERNPYAREATSDPSHVVALLFSRAPAAARARAFERALAAPERLAVRGAHAYAHYPRGIGRSPLTLARVEKALGVRGTGRNWNTVRKLGSACAASA